MPNDEELRKLLKPAVSEDQVRTILQDKYAAEGETVTLIRQLDAYDDQNFMVQIETKTYLFKIHNGVESRDYLTVIEQNEGEYYKAGGMTSRIHYTDAILSTLKRSNVTSYVHVPPRIHGDHNPLAPPLTVQKLPVIKSDYSPCDLVCRLLTWVHGRTMSTVKILPLASLADAGRYKDWARRKKRCQAKREYSLVLRVVLHTFCLVCLVLDWSTYFSLVRTFVVL